MVWMKHVGCLLLFVSGCVAPGSLDHRDKFESALKKQAAQQDGGAMQPDGGGTMSSSSADAGTPPASACPDVCMLLQERCGTSGCHSGSAPAGQLDLASSGVVMRLSDIATHTSACSGKKLIDTEDPDKSVLYGKLTDPPACGLRMPVGAPLSDDQIECVRAFVAEPACGGEK
jgi:hypothetical protein